VNNGSASWVYAFKLNGSFIWSRQIHGMVNAPITVVNGWFYTDTYDGSLSLVYGFKA
jgi:outer membrane protein assembly factor BamB